MKVVYKYAVNPFEEVTHLELPPFSLFLHFGYQNGNLYMWFEVNPDAVYKERRSFWVIGTGQKFSIPLTHLATTFQGGGEFVWHLYEEKL